MRVFLTGATGFIGSHVLTELLDSGHEILGLGRSDEAALKLQEAGAAVWRGSLEEPDRVAQGAAEADAVIHLAFDHNFANFQENTIKDARVIEAIGDVLAGSDRPFIITSGTGMGSPGPGQLALESVLDRNNANPRRQSELSGEEAAKRGTSYAAVRLPQVHNVERQGLVTYAIEVARRTGVSAYIGEGANRWPAASVVDVARLYRLALEQHRPGTRWHAVAEEGVPMRAVAERIGAGLGLPVRSIAPEEAPQHFGWLGAFASSDMPASSAWTRATLGWTPTGPTLLHDLATRDY